jgi:hypothetical protein
MISTIFIYCLIDIYQNLKSYYKLFLRKEKIYQKEKINEKINLKEIKEIK